MDQSLADFESCRPRLDCRSLRQILGDNDGSDEYVSECLPHARGWTASPASRERLWWHGWNGAPLGRGLERAALRRVAPSTSGQEANRLGRKQLLRDLPR